MLYAKPVHRPLGDLYLTVEFGDELSIEQNFLVIALDRALEESAVPGVRETVPTHRSLAVVYDPGVIGLSELSATIRELEDGLGELDEVPSRLVSIPIWYDDPWSRECALAHGVGNNIEYLAEVNGVSVEEVIAMHSGTEHWVAAVGFQPATYQAVGLDPSKALTAPKYERPRTRTPARIVCIAGQITSFYPVASPGGYQLLGRTPIELYDPEQRNLAFRDGPVLPRVSDRHRYVPIDEAAYHEIRSEVENETYEYAIEPGTFSLREYVASLRSPVPEGAR
jgi:urea carboxylase